MYVRKPTSLATNRIPKNAGTIYLICEGSMRSPKRVRKVGCATDFIVSQEERISYKPPSEELGKRSYFCIKRLKTFNSFKRSKIRVSFSYIAVDEQPQIFTCTLYRLGVSIPYLILSRKHRNVCEVIYLDCYENQFSYSLLSFSIFILSADLYYCNAFFCF